MGTVHVVDPREETAMNLALAIVVERLVQEGVLDPTVGQQFVDTHLFVHVRADTLTQRLKDLLRLHTGTCRIELVRFKP